MPQISEKCESRSVWLEMVLGYIKAGEDDFLFYQVKRQELQGKRILTVNEKYYVADRGVWKAVLLMKSSQIFIQT